MYGGRMTLALAALPLLTDTLLARLRSLAAESEQASTV